MSTLGIDQGNHYLHSKEGLQHTSLMKLRGALMFLVLWVAIGNIDHTYVSI